jgi:hypothetical protein
VEDGVDVPRRVSFTGRQDNKRAMHADEVVRWCWLGVAEEEDTLEVQGCSCSMHRGSMLEYLEAASRAYLGPTYNSFLGSGDCPPMAVRLKMEHVTMDRGGGRGS